MKVQASLEEIPSAEPVLAAALPLLKSGGSIDEVAKEFNCSRATLPAQHIAFQGIEWPQAIKEAFISNEGWHSRSRALQ